MKSWFLFHQYGSYFGASVCAADLNGDGLDDLLIGAPTFMQKYDEGRVYVYINREFVSTFYTFLLASI